MSRRQWIEVNQSELMVEKQIDIKGVLVSVFPNPSDVPVAARLELALHGSLYLYISYGRPQGAKKSKQSPKATYHYDSCGRILFIKFECIKFFHEWVSFRFGADSHSNLEMVRFVGFSLLGRPEYFALKRSIASNFKITER